MMTQETARIAVFLSGAGSNLKALMDASKCGILSGKIVLVVSNRAKAFGLTIAGEEGIETFVFKQKRYASPEEAGADLLARLQQRRIDYIALAGYLQLLPVEVVRTFRNRIVNIHPALLPLYSAPWACAASSSTRRLCLAAISFTASMSAGWP